MFSNVKLSLILSEHSIPSYPLTQTKNPAKIFFLKWMPRWLYNRAEKVVCVSTSSADEVNKIFKVSIQKIAIIYNPIDIEHVLELSHENIEHPWFAQKIPIIISVGRLTDIKGYPYLLRAFKKIITESPSRLVIVGQGEKEESLKELTAQLNIESSVAFLGFQPNPFKYMSRAKVFVLPSLSEAFPMVVLEAMTCGTPVISTATPGSSEIITNGIDGLLVPLADERSLVEATTKLLKDDALATSLAQAGRKRVDDFSVGRVIKEYEELFKTTS
jgi:glycosyltransferase involved in cell wall biosynthesis